MISKASAPNARWSIWLLCFLPLFTLGQNTYYHDFQLWHELQARYDATKKLSLEASYVCRNDGFDRAFFGSYYYLQARRKLSKHILVDGQIRVVDSHVRDLYRFEFGVMYRLKLHKDQLTVRLAWFNERDHLWTDEQLQHTPDNYFRARLKYRLDLPKKFQAYASVEIWNKLNREGLILKRYALIGGIDRSVSYRLHVLVEYMMQQEFDVAGPVLLQSVTLGLGYNFSKRHYGQKRGNGLKDD